MIASIVLTIALGLLAEALFSRLRLPGLLGMILVGVLIGPAGLNLLALSIRENAADIRLLALVVILLRAGLGLEKDVLRRVGAVALRMSAMPCLLEGFVLMLASHWLLALPWVEAGMLGFVVAAVSPAVIVPSMLRLQERGLGTVKGVPVIILAGASVDDVFAITLFTAFLGMATRPGRSILSQIAHIPLEVLGGVALGLVVGLLLLLLFRQGQSLTAMQKLSALLVAALGVQWLGERLRLAGLLGIMAMGLLLREKDAPTAAALEGALKKLWFLAQVFLFVLIGAEVDPAVAWGAGLTGLLVIALGLTARSVGVALALLGSDLNLRERLFCALAFLPKATVQAAIGGIPLAMGIASGELILAIAVLAVVITASLGAVAIDVSAPRLLAMASSDAAASTVGLAPAEQAGAM